MLLGFGREKGDIFRNLDRRERRGLYKKQPPTYSTQHPSKFIEIESVFRTTKMA